MRRLIILGASNVTRSFGRLVAVARNVWNEPLEILAAHGHGRSYGVPWTRVMARRLPGILSSGLWQTLEQSPPAPTAALVTDIGNDILYEHSVSVIAGWVEQSLDQLSAREARTIIARLPLENLLGLSEARFKFFRNLFMPGCSLCLTEVTNRAHDLNDRVEALARARGMSVVVPHSAWYGLDPIHIRQRSYSVAWREVLGAWQSTNENRAFSRAKLHESLYLRTRFPQRVQWFGRDFNREQPVARLRDGTTIALY